jgi:iron complex transport system permease protein
MVLTGGAAARARAPRNPVTVYALLALLGVALFAAALALGRGDLSDDALRATLLRLRLLRTSGAFIAGAALAAAGVVVQALFRNPLADPSVLGASAAASLGGQIMLIVVALAGAAPWLDNNVVGVPAEILLPLGCILGALGAMSLLVMAARLRASFLVVLLSGFVLTSVFLGISALLTSIVQESNELGRAVLAFTLGSVNGVGVPRLLLAGPLAAAGMAAAWAWGRTLDLLLSGEEEAASLGVAVGSARLWCVVWVAFLVAAAVAIGGNVAFVGLVAPHALRPLVGVETRRLLPAAGLAGGIFVVLCDLAARTIFPRGELPLGVVSGLVGAPLFLIMLRQGARRGRLG